MGLKVVGGRQARETLIWIRWGEFDYLSARMLLLNDHLIVGTGLANTAIEKYLKAIFIHYDLKNPGGHEVDNLYRSVVQQSEPNELHLHIGFLRLLRKAYKLRYPDEISEGFNIALSQAKILAQLDRSIFEITRRFRFIIPPGKFVPMVFEDATHKDKLYLTHKNIAMDSKQADAVFKSPRRYYEIRKAKGIVMEQTSNRPAVNDDLNFNEIGLPKRR